MASIFMRVMACSTDHGDVGIAERQRFPFKKTLAYRAGVASAARIDLVGRIKILDDARVGAGMPLVVSWIMATATNGAGQFNARSNRRIIRIRSVIAGGAVAILTLDTAELGGCGRTDEAGGKAITDSVTGQALRVFILLLIH